jgi:AcrR family transcriptional regulator
MTMGRPREFDVDQALDRALDVFRRKGYEGASLSALTRAMGITRPSLYAAFGNKDALYRQVLDRYERGPASYVARALAAATARATAEQLLHAAADLLASPGSPAGCLIVQGALACGDGARGPRRAVIERREAMLAGLRKRFERARAEGDLALDASPADLARYLTTIVNGMAVAAASGATRTQLHKTAAMALRAWPS